MSKKKQIKKPKYRDVELNIMPFIDVFSLLNVFLLLSAVFGAMGIVEIQIPFLTNIPAKNKDDPPRAIDIKVDMTNDGKVEVVTSWSKPPVDEKKKSWAVKPDQMKELHEYMVEIRKANPDNDKVSMFTEDEVLWENIALVLDAVKLRKPNDPVFGAKGTSAAEKAAASEYVYPKVVMASVMLPPGN